MNAKQIQALRNEMADLDRSTWFGTLEMLVEKDILSTSEVRQVLGINPPDNTTKPFDEHPDDCRGCRWLAAEVWEGVIDYSEYQCLRLDNEGTTHVIRRNPNDTTPPQLSWFPGVPEDCKEL